MSAGPISSPKDMPEALCWTSLQSRLQKTSKWTSQFRTSQTQPNFSLETCARRFWRRWVQSQRLLSSLLVYGCSCTLQVRHTNIRQPGYTRVSCDDALHRFPRCNSSRTSKTLLGLTPSVELCSFRNPGEHELFLSFRLPGYSARLQCKYDIPWDHVFHSLSKTRLKLLPLQPDDS